MADANASGGAQIRAAGRSSGSSGRVKLHARQVSFFNRQLASMARLNMPLSRGLKVLAREVSEPGFRSVIEGVQRDLEEGRSLQEAMSKFPASFNPIYLEMLKAGESTGNLAVVLDELARYTETMERMGRRIRDAMLYPIVILIMTLVFMVVFFYFLVPQFAALFASAGMVKLAAGGGIAELGPEITGQLRLLFSVSMLMHNPVFMVLGFVGIVGGITYGLFRLRRAFETYDEFLFYLPLFGPLVKMATLLKVTGTMRHLLTHGVSMVNALRLTAGVAGNNRVGQKLESIRHAVEEGGAFGRALTGSHFPDTIVWKLQMGEEKGVLEEAMAEVATELESDIESKTSYLAAVIAPVMLFGVATMLLLLLVSLYPQLLRMSTALGSG